MSFKWAALYYNFSTIFHELHKENYRGHLIWKDENNGLQNCDLPDCPFRKAGFVIFGHQWKPPLGTYE
jgi:hypothetical protein